MIQLGGGLRGNLRAVVVMRVRRRNQSPALKTIAKENAPDAPAKNYVLESASGVTAKNPVPPEIPGAAACILVEFRGQERDVIKWTDQKSGKAREMQKLNVSAEFAETGKHVTIEVMPPRGADSVDLLTFKKGDLLLVLLQNFADSREGCKARALSFQPFVVS